MKVVLPSFYLPYFLDDCIVAFEKARGFCAIVFERDVTDCEDFFGIHIFGGYSCIGLM